MSPEPLSLHQCSEEWPPQPAFSMALSAPGFPPAMTPQMDPRSCIGCSFQHLLSMPGSLVSCALELSQGAGREGLPQPRGSDPTSPRPGSEVTW